MFELTNEQRRCFAIPEVESTWQIEELKPSRFDLYSTFIYRDGNAVKKVITIGETQYCEYGVNETIADDGKMLLPKTSRGKPVPLTAATIEKRTPVGMALSYNDDYFSVFNNTTDQDYFNSSYAGIELPTFADFEAFVEQWCADTDEEKLKDINEFAARQRPHQKFRDGDFFRFRINRELWGYGRIMLDFNRLRKEKIPFWDVFMGKPLCVAVYHIASKNKNIAPEELASLPLLPSQMIMDNIFFYGECEIIGNRALTPAEEDYPIHYGGSIAMGEKRLVYQCGRTYLTIDGEPLYKGFIHNGIGWRLNVTLPVLSECIKAGSNMPYWNQKRLYGVKEDLRNPKFHKELSAIRRQFGLE